jgi:alpha-D-ribose 1-methylphosphonate 5-triphosphate synthase subunit PhnL
MSQFLRTQKKLESSHTKCFINTDLGSKTLKIIPHKALKTHFSNCVVLAGPPGAGKSTLATMVYNLMHGDEIPYFEWSSAMNS